MSTYLVTGAAGFIGSHCVDRLLAQGEQVVGLDNLRTGRLENLSKARLSARFEFVEQDVSDEAALEQLFDRHDFVGVLHLAALVSVPESFEKTGLNYRTNLAATDLIARQCLRHDCRRIVFASSAAVYGNEAELPNRETAPPQPMSPYAAAKLASEDMLLGYAASFDLEVVCFRYFNVYGVRQNPGSPYSGVLSIFTDRFASGKPVTVYGDGEQTRDFVSVSDVARANCHALTSDKVKTGRYNVCTGQAVSLNQVLAVYQSLYPDAPPISYDSPRTGDIRHSLGDPDQLHRQLCVSAEVGFEHGLRCLIKGLTPDEQTIGDGQFQRSVINS